MPAFQGRADLSAAFLRTPATKGIGDPVRTPSGPQRQRNGL
jgi:hypothetical protein